MGGQKKVAPSNYNTGIGIYDVKQTIKVTNNS